MAQKMRFILQNTTTMTPRKKYLRGTVAAFLLLFCGALLTHAQTTIAELYDVNENEVLFRIENLNKNETPSRILLVYDSSVITLESTSARTKSYGSEAETYAALESFRAAAALNALLAVEIERELELEDWMLQPFTHAQSAYLDTDYEEELALESWMTDLNSW
ncbi:MAG TPA: hypothetical protein DDX98_04495 [Bacteroidales bacterium]|nr:hypothetical protein [Bacteroidales bacterium]